MTKSLNNATIETLIEKASSYIDHMFRKGDISENDYKWLTDVNTEGSGFSPQDIIYMARENRDVLADRRRRVQEHRAVQDAATLGELNSFVRDLNEQDTSPFVLHQRFLSCETWCKYHQHQYRNNC